MKKVVLLTSSGIESACLMYFYLSRGYVLYPAYVRCGLPWERVEVIWLKRLWFYYRKRFGRILPPRIIPLKSFVRLRSVAREEDIEIPLRNMTLLLATTLYAHQKRVKAVAIGSLGMYPFPDNSKEYMERMEGLISEGLRENVSVDVPFMGRVPFNLTFSCASPVGIHHCGTCAKCRERKEGFSRAGVRDPTLYLS